MESVWNGLKKSHNFLKSNKTYFSGIKTRKIKVGDVVKANHGSISYVSIKILKENLISVNKLYKDTRDLQWFGAKNILKTILKGDVVSNIA